MVDRWVSLALSRKSQVTRRVRSARVHCRAEVKRVGGAAESEDLHLEADSEAVVVLDFTPDEELLELAVGREVLRRRGEGLEKVARGEEPLPSSDLAASSTTVILHSRY